MIGPAEIAEMQAEYAEMMNSDTSRVDRYSWPSHVHDRHLDGADRRLIGTYDLWIASITAMSGRLQA